MCIVFDYNGWAKMGIGEFIVNRLGETMLRKLSIGLQVNFLLQ